LKALAHLNKYFSRYRYRFAIGILCVTLSNLFAVFPAQAVRKAIDLVQADLESYRQASDAAVRQGLSGQVGKTVLYFAGLVLAFALVKGVFMYLMRQTLIVMSRLIEFDLKNEIFDHYQKLPLSFYRSNNTGDLMARISEDVGRVRMYVGPAVMYSINLAVTIILVVGAMFTVNARLAVLVLIPLPFLSYAIFRINTIINHKSDAIQSQLSRVTTFVQEAFSGIRVIKSFAAEEAMRKDFLAQNDNYYHRSMDLARTDAMFFPLMVFLTGLSTLITVFAGGMLVIRGEITIGNIAEFVLYVNMLTWPVASLGWVSSIVQRAAASQHRIKEFLHTPVEDAPAYCEPFALQQSVEFRNVSFRYPGKETWAVRDLSFAVSKGETLAILGTTGSGKSTIVQLLLRMMEPQQGQVLIDGEDIGTLNIAAFKQSVGYAPQDVFLFSDTISNNIAFGIRGGKPAEAVIRQAAADAALVDSVDRFPAGFETVVGERGITLSGGQKQRVAIARALIRDPHILVLDDCLSAVDTATEAEILINLRRIMKNKTAFIISHRVSSVKDATHIIVLDNGEVIERGTHASLMQAEGHYAAMYKAQLTREAWHATHDVPAN
jgi:ATP-binding cassette subfamily B protein